MIGRLTELIAQPELQGITEPGVIVDGDPETADDDWKAKEQNVAPQALRIQDSEFSTCSGLSKQEHQQERTRGCEAQMRTAADRQTEGHSGEPGPQRPLVGDSEPTEEKKEARTHAEQSARDRDLIE